MPATWVCVLLAVQGALGGLQYPLEVPAELVWLHVTVAAVTWVAILRAVVDVGEPEPVRGPSARATGESSSTAL